MPDEGTTTGATGPLTTTEPPATGATGGAGTDGDAALGAEGAKALEAWKQRAKDNERDAKRARELEVENDKLRQQTMTENEKAIEKAKADGRAEALSAVNERVIRSEIRAAAAGKLADPADAVAYLRDELDSFVDKKGDVDEKAIAAAVEALIKAKPYLAAASTNVGSADGGGRGAPAAHGDMNAALRRAAGR